MSLSIAYENVEDASMRLSSTVVLYDGEPVYIREVSRAGEGDPKGDVFRVYAEPLPYRGRGGAEMRKFISSKKFDMAPFPMGFMNREGYAYYTSRKPKKQQRQGLSDATFSATAVGFEKEKGRLSLPGVIQEQAFLDCIKGVYPSMDAAVKSIVSGEAKSVGISRSYALVGDETLDGLIYLYHKTEKVGFILDGALKLSKAARCLTESLREVGIKC